MLLAVNYFVTVCPGFAILFFMVLKLFDFNTILFMMVSNEDYSVTLNEISSFILTISRLPDLLEEETYIRNYINYITTTRLVGRGNMYQELY